MNTRPKDTDLCLMISRMAPAATVVVCGKCANEVIDADLSLFSAALTPLQADTLRAVWTHLADGSGDDPGCTLCFAESVLDHAMLAANTAQGEA